MHAVDFCIAKNIENVFLDYEDSKDILEDYKKFHSQETVPIILANNLVSGLVKKVGGYSDLLSYTDEKERS